MRAVIPCDERRAAPAKPGRSPVELTAALLRGPFTALVLWQLFWGGKSFQQLLRGTRGAGRRALARALEEMEGSGLVERRPGDATGPRLVYALTALGDSLKPVIGVMYEWGLKHARPSRDVH